MSGTQPAGPELVDALNTYHNKQTPPKEGERPELVAFFDAADRVLALAAELARVVTRAHQGAATRLYQGDWSQAPQIFLHVAEVRGLC